MAAKDLYTILQIPPTATMEEVKKAYRKLALQYHPDKNPDDGFAVNYFLEIKKAYEILRDTAKRQQYTYDRWQQKRNEQTTYEPITPQFILQKATELAKHVRSIDVFRMSHEALYLQVDALLSIENLQVLQQFQDWATNKKITETILKIVNPLSFLLVKKLETRLVKIAFTDNETMQLVLNFIHQKRKMDFWDKYNIVIILAVTVLICLIIFIVGN